MKLSELKILKGDITLVMSGAIVDGIKSFDDLKKTFYYKASAKSSRMVKNISYCETDHSFWVEVFEPPRE